jgi:putative ABC transport system permease protein
MTAMGIFWGLLMLIALAGAGIGLERKIYSNVEGFAANSAFFFPGQTSVPYKGFRSGRWWGLSNEDMAVIRNKIDGVDRVSGIIFGGGSVKATGGDREGEYSLVGYMPEMMRINPVFIEYGREINDLDMAQKRKVCMIGIQAYRELFPGGENPVGQTIRFLNSYFIVVGVFSPINNIFIGGDPEQTVIVPFSVLQQMLAQGDEFDLLAVTGKKNVDISQLENQIKAALFSRHNVAPDDKKAIFVQSIKEQFDMFNNLFLGIRFLTWIVGLGTLLAGIVGVSNIMLVVVRERTQEIGVRRALGAKPWKIISQVMSESFVLTFAAGVGGLALGVGLLSIVDSVGAASATAAGETFTSWQVSFGIAMGALTVLVLGGLLAGIIPAMRAMSIKAVDAIREE